MPTHYKDWEDIKAKSQSLDQYDRLAAITRGVFYLELALVAIGTQRVRREGVTQLLQNAYLGYPPDGLSKEDIYKTIQARNKAVHEGKIPTPDECTDMVDLLFQAWHWMRRKFVTPNTAGDIAKEILNSEKFFNAFLFGSLSRDPQVARDIDLLIFDDGDLSYIGNLYSERRNLFVRTIFEKAHIENPAWQAALDSDWIDILVVEKDKFRNDPNYIRNIASSQTPFFLLNITDGIKQYDKENNKWVDADSAPFAKWAKIRQELVNEGIIPLQ